MSKTRVSPRHQSVGRCAEMQHTSWEVEQKTHDLTSFRSKTQGSRHAESLIAHCYLIEKRYDVGILAGLDRTVQYDFEKVEGALVDADSLPR